MAIRSYNSSVDNTASVPLVDGVLKGPFVIVQNDDATNNLLVGDSTVSAANGITILPGASLHMHLDDGYHQLFAIGSATPAATLFKVLYFD